MADQMMVRSNGSWRRGGTPCRSQIRAVLVGVGIVALVLGGATGCRKKTPDERLQEIQELFQQGKVVNAVLKSKELIRDVPKDPASYEARTVLAFYYFQTGDPERSHEYLEEIYKGVGVGDMRGFQALMQDLGMYQVREDFKGGLEKVDWALQSVPHDSPTSAELHLAKAALLVSSKQPDEGTQLFHYLMLHAPLKQQRDQARELLAQHYRTQKNWQKVIDTYDDFLQAFPDTDLKPHFAIVKGISRKELGHTEEGLKEFEDGINTLKQQAEAELEKPKAADAWMSIAKYYGVAEMLDKAEETMKFVRKEFPKTPSSVEAGIMLGDLYVRQKRFSDAIEAYQQVRDENPLNQVAQQASERIQQTKKIQEQDRASTPTLTGAESATSPTKAQPAGS